MDIYKKYLIIYTGFKLYLPICRMHKLIDILPFGSEKKMEGKIISVYSIYIFKVYTIYIIQNIYVS